MNSNSPEVLVVICSIVLGVALGMVLGVAIVSRDWKSWAIENNYAHHDPKTGMIVYAPLPEDLKEIKEQMMSKQEY